MRLSYSVCRPNNTLFHFLLDVMDDLSSSGLSRVAVNLEILLHTWQDEGGREDMG